MSSLDAPAPLPAPPPGAANRVAPAGKLLLLALTAWSLGRLVPEIGPAICAMVLGMLVRQLPGHNPTAATLYAAVSRTALSVAIVLLGLSLNLRQVMATGAQALLICVATLSAATAAAWLFGRWLRVGGMLTALIGIGTAICGGSAIAAVVPILRPRPDQTAYAMSTIFFFNLLALLIFPWLGHHLGLSSHGFGLWAGTAINDTSSVVAAGYAYSQAAGDYATVVKLTRASLIVPVCLLLAAWSRRCGSTDGGHTRPQLPWFIPGFVVAAALASSGWLPPTLASLTHQAASMLMVLALAAIGMGTDLSSIHRTGYRPLLLGLAVSISVAVSSLLLQYLLHQL
ncbi:YeiH family protein [Frateuria aurantia]